MELNSGFKTSITPEIENEQFSPCVWTQLYPTVKTRIILCTTPSLTWTRQHEWKQPQWSISAGSKSSNSESKLKDAPRTQCFSCYLTTTYVSSLRVVNATPAIQLAIRQRKRPSAAFSKAGKNDPTIFVEANPQKVSSYHLKRTHNPIIQHLTCWLPRNRVRWWTFI